MSAGENRRGILLTASAACALTIFDTNLIGVITPVLVADLKVDFAHMAWLLSSFLLSFASLLLVAGSLADHYGRKRILVLGLSVFGGSALACSLASSVELLIVARVMQGVGAAFLLAPALAIIGQSFREPGEAVKAWAAWGSIMGLTMVVAPLFSSLVGAWLGWRWALGMMAPLCGLLVWQVIRWIEESRSPRQQGFDWLGALLFSLTMLAGSWSLIRGPEVGWYSPQVLWPLFWGSMVLCGFILWELKVASPMLQLRLFRVPAFVGAVGAMLGYAAAAQVMAAFLPVYLQQGLGVAVEWTGIALLPFALAMLIFPLIGRRLSAWLPSWQLLGMGLVIIALGNWGMAASVQWLHPITFFISMACLGAGGGLINGETQKAILGTVTASQVGMASGISTTARFLAMLMGYAGLSSVMLSGVREQLQKSLCPEQECWLASELVTAVATGDLVQAEFEGRSLSQQVALLSYQSGFITLFNTAAAIALVAAGSVFLLMGCLRERVKPVQQPKAERVT